MEFKFKMMDTDFDRIGKRPEYSSEVLPMYYNYNYHHKDMIVGNVKMTRIKDGFDCSVILDPSNKVMSRILNGDLKDFRVAPGGRSVGDEVQIDNFGLVAWHELLEDVGLPWYPLDNPVEV